MGRENGEGEERRARERAEAMGGQRRLREAGGGVWFVGGTVSLSVGLAARPPEGIRRICFTARANTSG